MQGERRNYPALLRSGGWWEKKGRWASMYEVWGRWNRICEGIPRGTGAVAIFTVEYELICNPRDPFFNCQVLPPQKGLRTSGIGWCWLGIWLLQYEVQGDLDANEGEAIKHKAPGVGQFSSLVHSEHQTENPWWLKWAKMLSRKLWKAIKNNKIVLRPIIKSCHCFTEVLS